MSAHELWAYEWLEDDWRGACYYEDWSCISWTNSRHVFARPRQAIMFTYFSNTHSVLFLDKKKATTFAKATLGCSLVTLRPNASASERVYLQKTLLYSFFSVLFLTGQFLPARVIAIIVCLCVCVCVCVTRRYCIKTAKRKITQTPPRDSPGTLICWSQNSLVDDPHSLRNLLSKWPTPF